MKPLISIVMPTYNRAHYLSEAIDSVIGQTYKNWELIIIDDGSTDSTEELVNFYMQKEPRITYVKTPNQGIAKSRNLGNEVAKGDYICVMDSDDWMLPYRLEKSLKAIKGVDGVYSTYIQSSPDGKPYGMVEPKVFSKVNLEGILAHQEIPHVTVMAKKSCFLDTPYRGYLVANDDLALILDWFKAGYQLKKVKLPLMAVRYHETNISKEKDAFIKKTIQDLKEEFSQ